MAITAVITKPALTQIFVGQTVCQFSALDSFKTTSSPADACLKVGQALWDFGDGTTGYGFEVQHVFQSISNFTVTLTVVDDGGVSSAPVTTSVNVTALPTYTYTKYVRADGSDSGTDGTLNVSAAADPLHCAYKTLERAFYDWRNGLPRGGWGRILIDTSAGNIKYTGNNDFGVGGVHAISPDYGPLLIQGVGGNAIVEIVAGTGAEIRWSDSGHDNTFGNPVFVDQVNVVCSVPQDPDNGGGKTTLNHSGSQWTNGVVTNVKVAIDGTDNGHGTAIGMALNNVTVSGAADVGIGISGGAQHVMIFGCTSRSNGVGASDAASLDHQAYVSGCQYIGIISTILDRANAQHAYSSLKFSGTTKFYVRNCQFKNSYVGVDAGANPTDGFTLDGILDDCIWDGIVNSGVYMNKIDRFSIRNPRQFNGCAQEFVREQSYDSTNKVINVQMVGASSFHAGGPVLNCTTSFWTAIELTNTIGQKAAATGPAIALAALGDVSRLTCDYSQWFVEGSGSSPANLFQLGATLRDLATWQGTDGKDTHGAYGDPTFFSGLAGDLTLRAGSPAIDTGFAQGIVKKDAIQTVRPIGAAYDKGALEASAGMTAEVVVQLNRIDNLLDALRVATNLWTNAVNRLFRLFTLDHPRTTQIDLMNASAQSASDTISQVKTITPS